MGYWAFPRFFGYAAAQSNTRQDDLNIIHFFTGLPSDQGSTPRIFAYPLYVIKQGEQITWQNDDTHAHQLKVTKKQASSTSNDDSSSSPIFESHDIQPSGNASFTFNDVGLYSVQSLTDLSLKGRIVVADKMTMMTGKSATSGLGNVALSWYPQKPKAGETTYFKIQFLDKQTAKNHAHVDYTFAILDSDGRDVEKSPGLIHSAEGKEFTSIAFASAGNYSFKVTVQGINFVPVAPGEVKFNVLVGA